ncbi:uncharacterized protein LOC108676018 isoform X2 [Hyalella azteca]|uniref:Uncharacterized protein LOC108676018 isoform X2 n=1 Tax=Hyalella azteca TaxID=294128 RepID=A0A8B7P0M3_HYAAZ|nr:uncharacterized protein LOC108676018 isoform X2 [Hyalella azteca]
MNSKMKVRLPQVAQQKVKPSSKLPPPSVTLTMKNHGSLLWLLVIGAVTMATATTIRETTIHESMSPEELLSIFHVDSHDLVPAYEVIKLHSRVRRGANDTDHVRVVHLNAFDKERVLNLRPNEDLARNVPVFFADHDPREGRVVLKPAASVDSIGTPYQDEETLAAVMLTKDPETGEVLVDGTVGDDLVVRPVPRSVLDVIEAKSQQAAGQQWRREEEQDLNAIRPPDDEAFLDEAKENLQAGDLVFSDGFPLVADDGTKSGQPTHIRVPYEKSTERPVEDKKLPEGLELVRKKRAAATTGAVHIVYKRKHKALSTDYAEMDPDHIPARSPNARHRNKRAAPAVIYPEILVLVDYDGYLLHGQDNSKIKSYYVSFWNGADLRYKLLRDPKVKISIAGIIISRSRDAMPYLERNRVDRDAIDSASALTDMGKYLFQERRLPTYDIAVAITKYDLCRRRKSGRCTTGTAGFAYVGGACVVNKRLKKVNSVAIVEDTGGFSGIIVAAHEVGHLLGAVHDGAPPPSYLGGPGAKHCRWEDGYIMSDLRHTEKGFRWSRCSVEQFHHFLNGDTATCLYNLPHEDESLPRILPGKLLSLDQQCRKDRGTSACFKDERVCAQLFCFDSSSGYCVSYRPAAEGSDCGGGKICLNGRCVYDNENTISDHDFLGSETQKPVKAPTSNPTTETTVPTSSTPPPTAPTTTTTTTTTTTSTTTTTTTTTPQTTTTPVTVKSTTPTSTTSRTTRLPARPKTTHRTTTSTSTTSRRTSISTSTTPNHLINISNNNLDYTDGECHDRIANIAGSLTCREFLKSYGSRYCGHRYIRKNCCSARESLCKDFLDL